ncbi:LysR family transcriptional regulator [Aliamphritea ceti]|uniref:LysR family transcriptional regulator n=1 Tax=Aliamphritea ceti TaxID=1524258 RepID=UPI0021C28A94|nr:LysR family transcriptional regulator [Aliamphritea ceti]
MNPHPPLHWLRTFAYAAQHKSFTKSAQSMNLTQAAVSKQMRALEQALNQPLFNREAHGISLTELGERYLVEVQAALSTLDGATEDLFGLRQRGVLQLRVNISFAHWVLSQRLSGLYERLPDLQMEMTHTVWDVNREPVGGDIDIRYGIGPWKGFSAMRLTRDELFPATGKNIQNPQDLPLINVLGYRSGWQWYAKQTGQPELLKRQQRSVDNSIIAYQMAAQGLGIVLARSSFMEHELASASLQDLDLPRCPTEEGFFALCSSSAQLPPSGREVWRWLADQFEDI